MKGHEDCNCDECALARLAKDRVINIYTRFKPIPSAFPVPNTVDLGTQRISFEDVEWLLQEVCEKYEVKLCTWRKPFSFEHVPAGRFIGSCGYIQDYNADPTRQRKCFCGGFVVDVEVKK